MYSDFKCGTLKIKGFTVLSVLPRNELPLPKTGEGSYNCSAHSFLTVQGSDLKSDPWMLIFSNPKYALLDVPKFGHICQVLGTKKSPPV